MVGIWEACGSALVEAKSGSGCHVGSAHGGSRGAEALENNGCEEAGAVDDAVVETCCGAAEDAFMQSVCC